VDGHGQTHDLLDERSTWQIARSGALRRVEGPVRRAMRDSGQRAHRWARSIADCSDET
jgi:hypothetical protein